MMWDKVVEKTIALLQADTTLRTLTGTGSNPAHIYRNRSRTNIQIPSVAYMVVFAGVEENYAPVSIQWDCWANSPETLAAIELRLFQLMHNDLPITVNGLLMWSQYLTRFDFLEQDQGSYHSALEFRYTPARENG